MFCTWRQRSKLAVPVTLFLPLRQQGSGAGRFAMCNKDCSVGSARAVTCQNPSYGMMSLFETAIKMYLVFLPLYVYAWTGWLFETSDELSTSILFRYYLLCSDACLSCNTKKLRCYQDKLGLRPKLTRVRGTWIAFHIYRCWNSKGSIGATFESAHTIMESRSIVLF